ncbi:NADH:ubiquinone oxidoreductase intermediate-associated protein 30 [Phialemonium atrogriseum]|uniref:NADH:ubiquinone oxidoreductase intermediate-associated protein 30 n=1 Tax=Phialemonium atrogriseum TaxID=1093897 RepID=A0AAJ0C0H7_9PEZI|nr:NADH:ubiquinone oxidoreductase intermediate-associated protein 30 [Phialemonium atrogriseum]KAK1767656.1 NADH:ubiquinone oxidoreductase intermediate-associated protein 30 [Phialemonium atrogriseum]
MAPTTAKDGTRYLFGGEALWQASSWTASDDRVRGGNSTSSLAIGQMGTFNTPCASFEGLLDITALGGAGFASYRTVDNFPELDLSGYDALVLDIAKSDLKKFTLVLKDTVLPKRPDGREQSTVSWEHDFDCPGDGGGGRVVMNLNNFKATYRGRAKPDAEPLNTGDIKRIAIMIRSFFGEQQGQFSITILSIAAMKHDRGPSPYLPKTQ